MHAHHPYLQDKKRNPGISVILILFSGEILPPAQCVGWTFYEAPLLLTFCLYFPNSSHLLHFIKTPIILMHTPYFNTE